MKKPLDFVVIGAQKSASTFIQACISEHPDAFMPPGEIPLFEDPDYTESKVDPQLDKLFERAEVESLWGIKRPNYISKPEVPARLYKHFPNAKLILILRDPIKRALSSYYHNIKYGFVPPISHEVGLPRIMSGELQNIYPRSGEVLEFGLYGKYLQNYLDIFNPNQILVMTHDEVLADQLRAVKMVYDFLEIKSDFVPANSLKSRPQAVVYSVPRLRLLSLRNKYMFEYYAGGMRLRPLRTKTIWGKLVIKVIGLLDSLILKRLFSNEKPKVSSGLRSKLNEYYAHDLELLNKLVEVNTGGWGQA